MITGNGETMTFNINMKDLPVCLADVCTDADFNEVFREAQNDFNNKKGIPGMQCTMESGSGETDGSGTGRHGAAAAAALLAAAVPALLLG